MDAFEREVCRRLPLADAVLRLLDFCTPDDVLNDIFDRYRGRSYTDILKFHVPEDCHHLTMPRGSEDGWAFPGNPI